MASRSLTEIIARKHPPFGLELCGYDREERSARVAAAATCFMRVGVVTFPFIWPPDRAAAAGVAPNLLPLPLPDTVVDLTKWG